MRGLAPPCGIVDRVHEMDVQAMDQGAFDEGGSSGSTEDHGGRGSDALVGLGLGAARRATLAMISARDIADDEAARVISRVEPAVIDMLGGGDLLDTPVIGGKFRGYRVGDGSVFAFLPMRAAKLAIDAKGMLVVATAFSLDLTHVQRAPRPMLLARILDPYRDAMRVALQRHGAAAGKRGRKFEAVTATARRIAEVLG